MDLSPGRRLCTERRADPSSIRLCRLVSGFADRFLQTTDVADQCLIGYYCCAPFHHDLQPAGSNPTNGVPQAHAHAATASEKRYLSSQAIVSSSEDAIIGKTLDGLVTSWNSGAETHVHSSEEMIGHSIERIIRPDFSNETQRTPTPCKS